ncbi:MAG TPA: hypothetical protein VFF48_00360 [Brevundimonas sp.]|nr:hypothetical protein [Brevundimonas sp.]
MSPSFRTAVLCALNFSQLSGCNATTAALLRPGEPAGGIRILPTSGNPVTVVLIWPCDASSPGANRLARNMALIPGRGHVFDVSAGCWNVAAQSVRSRQQVMVPPGGVVDYRGP